MSDLVKRSRHIPACSGCGEYPGSDIVRRMDADADALEALQAENREQALEVIAAQGQAQDAYEAQLKAEAERDRLREVGQFLLRAFDHINENPRRDPVDDLFLMVRDTSTISSVSDARAALGDDT